MNTKFTKGPWVKDKRGESLVGSDGRCVGIYNAGLTGVCKSDESVANSLLIASAPELHKLLEKCEKTFKALYPSDIKHVQPEHYSEFKAVHKLIGEIGFALEMCVSDEVFGRLESARYIESPSSTDYSYNDDKQHWRGGSKGKGGKTKYRRK